ncbi:hypothetical protein ABZ372_19495, partial [Streptomyces sp. NPDC005921]
MPSNASGPASGSASRTAGKNAAPPLPEPLRVPVADSHTHLDMQSGTVEEAADAQQSLDEKIRFLCACCRPYESPFEITGGG